MRVYRTCCHNKTLSIHPQQKRGCGWEQMSDALALDLQVQISTHGHLWNSYINSVNSLWALRYANYLGCILCYVHWREEWH